ncbi:54S ribosomal protein L12, mitochondrial [Malassezia yamatoensis]|uniref:54S ribosomal protein L12, mitochondrial n=1 Tax=Malassezia yamatoensis TaxID=253288 RepID=A0AAJ6CIK1_9BASI|nr:54S ribosomal protein L12, mitochondrial [Malassezia yamatoensis]
MSTPMGMRLMSRTACVMEEAASPKINSIVDEIEKLTLLEASELVSQLKTRLNITDIAMPTAAAPAAPAAASEEEPAEEKPKEKTLFTIRFGGLNADTAKAKVIKEIKAINSTMNLVEAKKFVESAPQTLKENVTKEDAEKIKAAIEAAGGKVELV